MIVKQGCLPLPGGRKILSAMCCDNIINANYPRSLSIVPLFSANSQANDIYQVGAIQKHRRVTIDFLEP